MCNALQSHGLHDQKGIVQLNVNYTALRKKIVVIRQEITSNYVNIIGTVGMPN